MPLSIFSILQLHWELQMASSCALSMLSSLTLCFLSLQCRICGNQEIDLGKNKAFDNLGKKNYDENYLHDFGN